MARTANKSAPKRGRPTTKATKAASATAPKRRGPQKGFKKASTSQTIQMHDLLKQNFTVDENGRGQYAEGWSDERIAEEVEVPHSAFVARMRRELFGTKVRTGKPKVEDQIIQLSTALSALAALPAQIAALNARLGDLEFHVGKTPGVLQNPQNLPSANQAPTAKAA